MLFSINVFCEMIVALYIYHCFSLNEQFRPDRDTEVLREKLKTKLSVKSF